MGIAMVRIIQFAALLLTALSMGVHFGTWLTERPLRRTQSGALFIEVHQERDRVAARVMPILGTAALVFLALATFLMRAAPAAFALSLAGLVLCIGDALVTAFVNVPINREMQGWQPGAPPAEWSRLRDRWERFHSVRTLLIVSGFALFSASVVLFDNS
jgi:Anthrone oxygenase